MSAISYQKSLQDPPSSTSSESQLFSEKPPAQQDRTTLQVGSRTAESGKILEDSMVAASDSRPDKPKPFPKTAAFSRFRDKPERKRSSHSTNLRSLEALQFARQFKRLEMQKRTRAAEAKGGRMDRLLEEKPNGTKGEEQVGKLNERRRKTEAKVDGKQARSGAYVVKDNQSMQIDRTPGRSSGKENKAASSSRPKTQTLDPDAHAAFAMFNSLGISDAGMTRQ